MRDDDQPGLFDVATERTGTPAAGGPLTRLIDGTTYDAGLDGERLKGQHARVLATMSDGQWHTLAGLAATTGATEASVSARLRDLRKLRFGGRVVHRRRVVGTPGLHEYRLDPTERVQADEPDGTLPHLVNLIAIHDETDGRMWLSLTCTQCPWVHRMPSGSPLAEVCASLARHPKVGA